jgi:hypothetical protein
MLGKMKASVAKAADSTSRATKSLSVKSSLSAQHNAIDAEKRSFGTKAYDALEANDQTALQAAFAETKAKIDTHRTKIAELEKELESLQHPKEGEHHDAPAAETEKH